MSTVRPFRGYRPRPELAGDIAAPPYDVLSSEEARAIVRNNSNSFLRVNKPEVDFPEGTTPYSKEVYSKGRKNLESLIATNKIIQDDSPCFYLHRLTWRGQSQTGLVALCSLDEFESSVIKKHERTRPDKVNDRAEHILAVGGQVGPVMMAFHTLDETLKLIEKLSSTAPDIEFESDNVQHQVWLIGDSKAIEKIQSEFSNIPNLYIADGHHRSESAAEVRRRKKAANSGHTGYESYNFFLAEIFPSSQMRIMPYFRIISDFNGTKLESLLSQARENFSLTSIDRPFQPQANNTFGFYTGGKWYQLEAKPGTFDPASPTGSIGSAILENVFFKPILGITDVRKDSRVEFVGGIRGLSELERMVNSGAYKMAFSVSPVTIEQLLKVADAGEIMPPKSTWFEPKLKSGLIIHLFDN